MYVLGIDPGLANCGWAVVNDTGRIVDLGVIKTTVKLEHDHRICTIYDKLRQIVVSLNIEQVVNERLPYNSKMMGTSGINEVIGTIALLCAQKNCKRIEYSPLTAKKTIIGNGKADKDDVIKYIKTKWEYPLVEHSADAAMLALTYLALDYRRLQDGAVP